MNDTAGRIAIAHYRVKPGSEKPFEDILRRHTATLRELELVTERPVEVYVGSERGVEGPLYVEIFEWASVEGSRMAHSHPRVSEMWESMATLCEERGGRPMFEFPNVRPVDLS